MESGGLVAAYDSEGSPTCDDATETPLTNDKVLVGETGIVKAKVVLPPPFVANDSKHDVVAKEIQHVKRGREPSPQLVSNKSPRTKPSAAKVTSAKPSGILALSPPQVKRGCPNRVTEDAASWTTQRKGTPM